jgi:hypothetical protein
MKHLRLWMAYIDYARRGNFGWPSRLQRLFMQGDPTGEVARISAAIRGELYAELDSEPARPEGS